MDVDIWTLLGLLAEHGSALTWAVIKGVLLWGIAALVATILIYILCSRLGWLDIRGERKRGARVAFVLILWVGVGPLATGAGVTYELRKATVRSVRQEVGKTQVLRTVGGVLVAPAILAHLVAEQRYVSAQAAALSWKELAQNDLSFLTRADSRQRAFALLTEELIRTGTKKVPGYDSVEKNRILKWLVHRAETKMAAKVTQKTSLYVRLFEDIKPDKSGKLPFASAADQVGMAFWREAAEPAIRAPFDAFRLKLLIAALLLIVLGLVAIQLIGRRVAKPGASGTAPGTGATASDRAPPAT